MWYSNSLLIVLKRGSLQLVYLHILLPKVFIFIDKLYFFRYFDKKMFILCIQDIGVWIFFFLI